MESHFPIYPGGDRLDGPVCAGARFPHGSENPVVALMALDAPMLLWVIHGWYAAMPGVITFHRRHARFGHVAGLV